MTVIIQTMNSITFNTTYMYL